MANDPEAARGTRADERAHSVMESAQCQQLIARVRRNSNEEIRVVVVGQLRRRIDSGLRQRTRQPLATAQKPTTISSYFSG
ncbi:hypothetical protein Y032_0062g3339 [Ancylostoma ceylanicum]|nr:hypothetical protein Y032_0062g3339 [Ancylostoma ceylanicum]